MTADWSTRRIRRGVRTRASRGRGGCDRSAGSTGSTPSDCAGGPSIIISVQVSGCSSKFDMWQTYLSRESA